MVLLTKLKPEPMGAHSLSVAYGVNSLVMSDDGAAAYISVKDVPAGTPLSNTDYWRLHTDLTAVRQSAEAAAQKANAARNEMLEIARNLTDAVEKSGNPVQAVLVGGLPFDRVTTALSPMQAGSGDPSPTNIRKITGWTGAKLNHSNAAGVEYTYSVSFGQTVGSGTLDWQTGVMTVDRVYKAIDGTNIKAVQAGAATGKGNAFIIYAPDALMPPSTSVLSSITCSHYKTVLGGDAYNGVQGICIRATGAEIYIYDSARSTMTGAQYNDWLAAQNTAGTPVQVVYKLATPITIQLTPREIKQLQGVNTLYGDGSISIAGRANPALALDARIAALEAAATAE